MNTGEWKVLRELEQGYPYARDHVRDTCLDFRGAELRFWEKGGFRNALSNGQSAYTRAHQKLWPACRKYADTVQDDLVDQVVEELIQLVREINALPAQQRQAAILELLDVGEMIQEITRERLAIQMNDIITTRYLGPDA